MNVWNDMLGNQILVSAVVGWTVAQVLKTLIDCALNKSFNAERLVGSGGMPSSHSATVCALTTAAALEYGAGSFEFAVSFVLAMVVMYDAIGVRRETGKQAKLLNSILMENPLKLNAEVLQEKLKEYVGHTPFRFWPERFWELACLCFWIPIIEKSSAAPYIHMNQQMRTVAFAMAPFAS